MMLGLTKNNSNRKDTENISETVSRLNADATYRMRDRPRAKSVAKYALFVTGSLRRKT